LPLIPGMATKLGFGLWNSVIGTLLVEGGIFAAGVWLYVAGTAAKNKRGIYAFLGYVVFIVLIYIINLTGPPPPDAKVIGYVGLSAFIFTLWAWWADRNRRVRG
jgi:hypothetical protein